MKEVVAVAGKVSVSDVPEPSCSDTDVLVKTSFSVISTGTETWTVDSTEPLGPSDLVKDTSKLGKAVRLSSAVLRDEGFGGFKDYLDFVRNPRVPVGYSCSGVVVQVGRKVADISVGDRVACAGEGKATHAELVSVPRNLLVRVPKEVGMKEAAFTTIGSIAIHAFRQSKSQISDSVAVIGAGLVGNLVAQIAKASGCRIAIIDLREDRLSLARELGVDLAIRSDDDMLVPHLTHFTDGRGFDSVLICAATNDSGPINIAAQIARNRGKIVVVGRIGMKIERKDYYQKELELVMSRSLGPGRYDPLYEEKGIDYPIEYVRWTLNRNMGAFLELVKSKNVDVSSLVGGEFPIERAVEAYSSLGHQSKVAQVLSYESSSLKTKEKTEQQQHAANFGSLRTISGPIKVALVGPGNFAKETLMPLLRRNRNFLLRWVVSSNTVHAGQIAKRYGFQQSTCNIQDVLSDPETDLVVVSAPNNLHYPMIIQSLEAGKPVFVEKPLCITRFELGKIRDAQRIHGMPVVVGFNRRYAPLVLSMRKAMSHLDGPFFITYRVNAGFIPKSRSVQDPEEGGGRIIAECCHFFDLFNFLLGKQPNSEIQVTSTEVNGSTSVARDNVVVVLRYPDGSVATLVYVAMGHKEMDRERIEVFAQGTSIVLEDFKTLKIYGNKNSKEELKYQDKGHRGEFQELANSLKSKSSEIISFEDGALVTELTFRVDEALRNASNTI